LARRHSRSRLGRYSTAAPCHQGPHGERSSHHSRTAGEHPTPRGRRRIGPRTSCFFHLLPLFLAPIGFTGAPTSSLNASRPSRWYSSAANRSGSSRSEPACCCLGFLATASRGRSNVREIRFRRSGTCLLTPRIHPEPALRSISHSSRARPRTCDSE